MIFSQIPLIIWLSVFVGASSIGFFTWQRKVQRQKIKQVHEQLVDASLQSSEMRQNGNNFPVIAQAAVPGYANSFQYYSKVPTWQSPQEWARAARADKKIGPGGNIGGPDSAAGIQAIGQPGQPAANHAAKKTKASQNSDPADNQNQTNTFDSRNIYQNPTNPNGGGLANLSEDEKKMQEENERSQNRMYKSLIPKRDEKKRPWRNENERRKLLKQMSEVYKVMEDQQKYSANTIQKAREDGSRTEEELQEAEEAMAELRRGKDVLKTKIEKVIKDDFEE